MQNFSFIQSFTHLDLPNLSDSTTTASRDQPFEHRLDRVDDNIHA
jgi:hypothetical protein